MRGGGRFHGRLAMPAPVARVEYHNLAPVPVVDMEANVRVELPVLLPGLDNADGEVVTEYNPMIRDAEVQEAAAADNDANGEDDDDTDDEEDVEYGDAVERVECAAM